MDERRVLGHKDSTDNTDGAACGSKSEENLIQNLPKNLEKLRSGLHAAVRGDSGGVAH